MPGIAMQKNIGAFIRGVAAGSSNTAGAPALIIAGGAGDNVQVVGPSIDRTAQLSASLVVSAIAALATNETLAFAVDIQDDDNSGFTSPNTVVLQAETILLTDPGGGSNQEGVLKLDVLLQDKQQFIRFRITPNLSRGSIDTATFGSTAVLGGDDQYPSAAVV